MNKKEFVAAVRAAKRVYGKVKLSKHDTYYMRLVKQDVIETVKMWDIDEEIDAVLRDDGSLYIY